MLADNGWVYEQVCLVKCFKLPINLMANLLIYRVMHRILLTIKLKTDGLDRSKKRDTPN